MKGLCWLVYWRITHTKQMRTEYRIGQLSITVRGGVSVDADEVTN